MSFQSTGSKSYTDNNILGLLIATYFNTCTSLLLNLPDALVLIGISYPKFRIQIVFLAKSKHYDPVL